jgi:non-heme chloroperoxidase
MILAKRNCIVLLLATFCGPIALSQIQDKRPGMAAGADNNGGTPALIRDSVVRMSDGTKIHFLAAGQMTSSPALVLIPGWTLTASLWDQQLRTFSASRLVIAVDSRSQGESSITLSGNTPERRAIDLHELIASLDITKFVVVGWSQGGQDVAAYIQEYGTDSLAGIVFVDSTVSYGPAEIDVHKEFSKSILSGLATYDAHSAEFREGMVRSILHKPHPDLDIQHVIDESMKTPPSIGMAMWVADIFGMDRRPALKKIDRPTLVIASAESPLLEVQKEMAETIPGARWVVVPDTGHALFIDAPERFDDELAQLLKVVAQPAR